MFEIISVPNCFHFSFVYQNLICFPVNDAQISEDGQWIWVNEDWKLISELDKSDYNKYLYSDNGGHTHWIGRSNQIIVRATLTNRVTCIFGHRCHNIEVN